MRKIALILIFIFLCFHSEAQTKNSTTLKGKIFGELTLGPYCGFQAFGSVIEFRIINLSGLDYSRNNIGIIIRCPEIYGEDFFVSGKTYEMEIETEVENGSMFDYIVLNEKTLEKYKMTKRLWAVNDSIKRIE